MQKERESSSSLLVEKLLFTFQNKLKKISSVKKN